MVERSIWYPGAKPEASFRVNKDHIIAFRPDLLYA